MLPYRHTLLDMNREQLVKSGVGKECFQKQQHVEKTGKGGKPDI